MQLELALSEHPSTASMLWEQFDPKVRQAVIDRLALAIAKAAVPASQQNEESEETRHKTQSWIEKIPQHILPHGPSRNSPMARGKETIVLSF